MMAASAAQKNPEVSFRLCYFRGDHHGEMDEC